MMRSLAMRAALVLLTLAAPCAAALPPFAQGLLSSLTEFWGSRHCIPSQVHLALTGKSDEMRVMWKTRSRSCQTTVHYSETSQLGRSFLTSKLQHRQGKVRAYSGEDMCASPARDYAYDISILHDVVLSNLVPRRWYSYRVAHSGRILKFQAPPPTGPAEGFQFLAYGDMGDPHHRQVKAPGAQGTVDYTKRDVMAGANLVLHVGDLSYANGREYVWNSFMDAIEPAASRVPYMITIGNHEYDYRRGGGHRQDPSGASKYDPDWGNYGNDSGGECGVSVVNRFTMPGSDTLLASSFDSKGAATSRANVTGDEVLPAITSADALEQCNRGDQGERDDPRMQQLADLSGNTIHAASAIVQLPAPLSAPKSLIGQESNSGHNDESGHQAPLTDCKTAATNVTSLSIKADSTVDLKRKGSNAANPNPPFWYSYNYGSVHFVAISSEHDLRHSSHQARWLRKDLKGVDDCLTPWIILLMHRPMYVVFPHKSNRIVGEHLRQQLEKTLNKFQVDLVVSGHVHSYARTCNVLDKKCIPIVNGGTTHITLGCGGHKLSDSKHNQPAWLEAHYVHYGYGRITVHDGNDLTFEYVRSSDGKVYDTKTLHNERADQKQCFA